MTGGPRVSNVTGLASASDVANIGAHSAMTGVDGTGSNAAPLEDVNTDLGTIHTKLDQIINRLNNLRTKQTAILTALKSAGIMVTDN